LWSCSVSSCVLLFLWVLPHCWWLVFKNCGQHLLDTGMDRWGRTRPAPRDVEHPWLVRVKKFPDGLNGGGIGHHEVRPTVLDAQPLSQTGTAPHFGFDENQSGVTGFDIGFSAPWVAAGMGFDQLVLRWNDSVLSQPTSGTVPTMLDAMLSCPVQRPTISASLTTRANAVRYVSGAHPRQ